jgi:hypothetical protein
VCDPYHGCREDGKISWDNRPCAQFLHIRFDGCICRDSAHKKCDCIIFRFEDPDRPVMFAIEVKDRNPDIVEVQQQIQYCLDTIVEFLPNPKSQFVVIPVLCANAFSGLNYRALFSYRVKVSGVKTRIRKRHHGEDINTL